LLLPEIVEPEFVPKSGHEAPSVMLHLLVTDSLLAHVPLSYFWLPDTRTGARNEILNKTSRQQQQQQQQQEDDGEE
jgi:hypothetical protein